MESKMLQEAIDLQNEAVARLVELTEAQDEITFKAPTGSGKTHMMAAMMSQILAKDKDVIFLVSSLSKGGLAGQNYEKFREYATGMGEFANLNPFLISTETSGEESLFIPEDYNVYLLPRDLSKKNGKLMQGAMLNFLSDITLTQNLGGLGKKIYLIKDECHIATHNLDDLSANFFSKVYNFSATPNLSRGQHPDVEIKNDEAVNAKLIKNVELVDDPNVKVGVAIDKFEEIKAQYRNLLGVNPCLIIQISNKDKADGEIQEIMTALNQAEHADLKWMLIMDKDKDCNTNDTFRAKNLPVNKWRDYAKQNLSTIDIIIFKMVITEGWDIPRACMLYQMRDSKSKQLDEQVMGRVRRNPRLLDFETLSDEAQKLASQAWIWGIVPPELQRTFGVKLWSDSDLITDEVRIKTTRLKSLSQKSAFKIDDFIEKQPKINAPTSIFTLYTKLQSSDASIQKMCDEYAESYARWRDFTERLDVIIDESKKYICDYQQSMEVTQDEHEQAREVSFAVTSHYQDNGNYINIADWVWKRADGKDKFSFDSDAEREWAEILKDLAKDDNAKGERVAGRKVVGRRNPRAGEQNLLGEREPDFLGNTKNIYMWGKNYVGNSEIKFEYYLGALHSSYPDFIMKDAYGRVHIFEVKSVNISSRMVGGFDNNIYKNKVEELKKAYKQASKLTQQIFYLPILRDDDWRIFQYMNGEEAVLSIAQFIDFCKNSN